MATWRFRIPCSRHLIVNLHTVHREAQAAAVPFQTQTSCILHPNSQDCCCNQLLRSLVNQAHLQGEQQIWHSADLQTSLDSL